MEGHPDQSLEHSRESLALARQLDHPSVLTLALMLAAELHRLRREAAATEELAVASLALASEHGLSLFAAVTGLLRGWARVEQGELEEGIAELRRSLDAYRAIGADSGLPQYLAMLAEAHARAGQPAEGLEAIRQALEIMDRTDERWWEADLHRLRGELMLAASGSGTDAESCFLQAIDVARDRRARSLELRSTMSLARLWRDQGRTAEAKTDPGGDLRLLHRRPRHPRSRGGSGAAGGTRVVRLCRTHISPDPSTSPSEPASQRLANTAFISAVARGPIRKIPVSIRFIT